MNLPAPHEFKKRIEKVQQLVEQENAEACIISSPVNLYYLLGEIFDGYMYIMPNKESILFVKRPVDIKRENVIFIRKPEQIPELLKAKGVAIAKKVLLESDVLAYCTIARLQKALDMPQIGHISGYMRQIRTIKSDWELQMIRQSAASHARVYQQVPSLYRAGMTDLQLQIEIEYVMRKEGSIGTFRSFGENMDIYMGSLLAGDNAQVASPFDFALGGRGNEPLLPLGSANKPLKEGTTVMVDMAGNYSPYISDMTRTFSIGAIPEEAHRAHQLSIDIHADIIDFAKEGTACAEVYERTMQHVIQHRMEDYFMGTTQQAKFVGHGLGLEINEPPVFAPRSRDVLQKNMAIAFEPKFVLPGIGAVGIENTYFVTSTGLEKITHCNEDIVPLY